jgi:hypothetical protein
LGIDIDKLGRKRGKASVDALIAPPAMRFEPRYLM